MIQSLKKIVCGIGWTFSFFVQRSFNKALKAFSEQFYTGLHKRQFARLGSYSILSPKAKMLIGLDCIFIGEFTRIGAGVQLTVRKGYSDSNKPKITIGNHCLIRYAAHITAINSITIGDNLLTGTNVLITDNAHGEFTLEQLKLPPTARPLHSKGPVVIGNNVWLGNNVCVLPGVTIGDGAVIGANSVVTHDIPAYSMAAGVPASIIKQL